MLTSLSYHATWRIEHAIATARENGTWVRTVVEVDGVRMRVVVSKVLDKDAVLRERSAKAT